MTPSEIDNALRQMDDWPRLMLCTRQFGHAYVNAFVEPLKRVMQHTPAYALGHVIAVLAAPVAIPAVCVAAAFYQWLG